MLDFRHSRYGGRGYREEYPSKTDYQIMEAIPKEAISDANFCIRFIEKESDIGKISQNVREILEIVEKALRHLSKEYNTESSAGIACMIGIATLFAYLGSRRKLICVNPETINIFNAKYAMFLNEYSHIVVELDILVTETWGAERATHYEKSIKNYQK